MKNIKRIKNIVYAVVICFLVAVATLVIVNRFEIAGIRSLVVQSGSMEPSIGKHSIVLVRPAGHISIGDVITFKQSGRDDVLVTHRVEGQVGTEYITKGDANEEADGEAVHLRNVIGKVFFTVPFLGAVISFAKTTPGFILLVVVPAVIIVYSEFIALTNQLKTIFQNRKTRKALNTK